ncbi:MAG TPA: sulfite oxidase [Solirubrobacteraceae bacterium]|nr:sulfite oxidase [Solirubrobacteraceae bacterium]
MPIASGPEFLREEVALALRNPGMPLEALRHPVTPIGMHYVLVHFDVPLLDATTHELVVDGRVRTPLRLSLEELRARPAVSMPVMLECAGSGRAHLAPRPVSAPWHDEAVGCAEWTGTPLRAVLADAGVLDGAVEVLFTGRDRGVDQGVEQDYQRSLPVAEALQDDVLLAYAMNGEPLPPSHGFPLRLIVPGWYGMASVKWLSRVTVLAEPFEGVQQTVLYRFRRTEDDPGSPVTRQKPHALMAPPGIPEFLSRIRHVRAGRTLVEGRAWSGRGAVTRVEFSADGGRTWADATLGERLGPHAWTAWAYEWRATEPGEYELCVRATDASGETQPLDAAEAWNLGGYGVNAVQRVTVRVTR